MVVAFLIHTVLPGPCRMLYSVTFGYDSKEDQNETNTQFDNPSVSGVNERPFDLSCKIVDPDRERSSRKDTLSQIALRVQSEYGFKNATSYFNRTFEEILLRINMDNCLPDLKMGVFRQPSSKLFHSDKMVIWQAALNCGFTLVCEMQENVVLAEHVLRLLIKHLQHYAYVLNRPVEILSRMDRIAIIVDEFLPGGQLLFQNDRAVKQLQRNLEMRLGCV